MLLATSIATVLEQAVEALVGDVVAALPAIIGGVLFFVVAVSLATVAMRLFRAALRRALPGAEPAYRQFIARIVGIFLWFGVLLAFLSVVGLEIVAASLGTASGFLALGVSYALSGMLADAVSGVYLLRDPDFNPGDEVSVGDMTGIVSAVELRKTRFAVGDDTVVRANADIEKRWTKVGTPAE